MKVILIFCCLLVSSSSLFAQSSKELLAQAISLSNSINNNLTVEQKLLKHEEIQRVIDKIISEYSGTDEGISLLSRQVIGNFDYSSIVQNYVTELTGYYDTVCKVSPNFTCIAFVSLNNGVQACSAAEDFSSLENAHRDIMNSLEIFISQGVKDEIRSLALNSYRNCLSSSKMERSKSIEDHFSGLLVPFFIELGKIDLAKAMIQQLDDPYLKFASVFELTKASGAGISLDFIDRMGLFIEEKLRYQDPATYEEMYKWQQIQTLAGLKLETELLLQTDLPLSTEREYKGIGSYPDEKDAKNDRMGVFGGADDATLCPSCGFKPKPSKQYFCTTFFNKILFETNLKKLNAEINRMDELKKQGYFGKNNADSINSFLDACGRQTEGPYYGTALDIYGRISRFSAQEASKFLTSAAAFNYDKSWMQEYIFLFEGEYPQYDEWTKGILGERASPFKYDEFYVFKKLVRDGDVCKAVEKLFKEFKGKPDYNKSISYLIESPEVDRNKNYDCGDAELELLLQ
jgi:hypothetical protein